MYVSFPPRPGQRCQDAQVNPPGPQLLDAVFVPDDPVSTFTAENPRAAFSEPQSGQRGLNPFEYAAIDARRSNSLLQS
jgi:hypothetical protein